MPNTTEHHPLQLNCFKNRTWDNVKLTHNKFKFMKCLEQGPLSFNNVSLFCVLIQIDTVVNTITLINRGGGGGGGGELVSLFGFYFVCFFSSFFQYFFYY